MKREQGEQTLLRQFVLFIYFLFFGFTAVRERRYRQGQGLCIHVFEETCYYSENIRHAWEPWETLLQVDAPVKVLLFLGASHFWLGGVVYIRQHKEPPDTVQLSRRRHNASYSGKLCVARRCHHLVILLSNI